MQIVEITRREVYRINKYVAAKERTASEAQPVTIDSDLPVNIDRMIKELNDLKGGKEDAYRYQDLILRILNFLFEPDLIDGKPQVRTEHGTEIRDIIFTNESDTSFWKFIREKHGNFLVVFELKNKEEIDNSDIDQLTNYLGDPTGYVGILISRKPPKDGQYRKAIAIYNKIVPRRIVLFLSDQDLEMLVREEQWKRSDETCAENL